jgi:Ca2+-binding RTX toxin-like protein
MAIINGTKDPETLNGTPGDDVITGGRAADLMFGGAGNDVFVWNPGDGSDTIDGQTGFDTLQFNGANINERFEISANGHHAQFTRDVANIVMDTDNVERIEIQARGGSDTLTVDDLSGTAVKEVAIDLGGIDGAADTVTDNGTGGNDRFDVTLVNGLISVVGAHKTVTLANVEGVNDALVIQALGGNDVIDAGALPAGTIRTTIDGGAGNDKITGSQGDDVLIGGDGNDTVIGSRGNDVAFLGAGDDRFEWSPGDGSDIVEGQSGFDTLRFDGSNVSEDMQLFANGGRAELTRDVGSVVMDLNGVERVAIVAHGGADTITVGDMTGAGVTQVTADLGTSTGKGFVPDGQVDTVVAQGTQGGDLINVSVKSGEIFVTGLAAAIDINHADKNDILTVNGLGGDDVIDASQVTAGKIQLQLNGGQGSDLLVGSAGDDIINGAQGSDTVFAGAGNDRILWNPGDGSDIVEGQAGFDTLAFNGANINEQFELSANGDRVRMTRDVANIAMDLHGVERIELAAKGGADTITIDDLTGTGVKQVAIDLAGFGNTGDGAADSIVTNGSNAASHVVLSDSGAVVTVTGLPETLTIANADFGDSLRINTFGGNDTIDARALHAGAIGLTISSGGGNDTIFGSGGADLIFGGDGNDTVSGGAGDDAVFLGGGNDVFKWQAGDGSDLVEGEGGTDTLSFTGGPGADSFQILADGTAVAVTTSDGAHVEGIGMEQVKLALAGGGDTVTIGDLSGASIQGVAVDLGAGSKGDTVNLTLGVAETLLVSTTGNHMILTNETTFQTVTIDNANGSDVLNITSAPGDVPGEVVLAGDLAMALHFTGGAGADIVISGSGDDFIDGNRGNDVALMGAGNDTFNWDPGDGSDTVDGQSGFDTLHFNGANIAEQIDIIGNGTLAELTRNVANIDMHLNNVERIEVNALGGADNIHVHDLSGSVVKEVAIDLGGFGGAPDGAADTVTVEGSKGNDHATLSSSIDGTVSITGLTESVSVSHGEAQDTLVLNGNEGKDTIDASGVQDGTVKLTLDGGAGDDTVTGGHGGDLIFGGDGHDVLNGGDGGDTLDGGSGDDVLTGGKGDDTIFTGDGADTIQYTGALDGHDLIVDFTGGQDKLDLTKLFDSLGVDPADREGRVSIIDHGNGTVDIAVDADGNAGNGFELNVATLNTGAQIKVGDDVVVHH